MLLKKLKTNLFVIRWKLEMKYIKKPIPKDIFELTYDVYNEMKLNYIKSL